MAEALKAQKGSRVERLNRSKLRYLTVPLATPLPIGQPNAFTCVSLSMLRLIRFYDVFYGSNLSLSLSHIFSCLSLHSIKQEYFSMNNEQRLEALRQHEAIVSARAMPPANIFRTNHFDQHVNAVANVRMACLLPASCTMAP